tara:strand:+ start:437 stop:1039 length:603 start_codon:yes stop_codon:yes gene_type:complete
MSPLAFGMGKSSGAAFDFAIFYSDKLQFYWNWTDGKDFDLRAEFIRPTQLAGVTVGHGKTSLITDGGGSQVYMKWGGDNNTDTVGYEGIYIDIDRLKNVAGGLTDNIIELDLRGIWYAEVGQNPVVINATGYEGGVMALEDETVGVSGYGFVNTGYAKSFTDFKSSVPVVVSSTNREDNGQRMARAIINLDTYQITFFQN